MLKHCQKMRNLSLKTLLSKETHTKLQMKFHWVSRKMNNLTNGMKPWGFYADFFNQFAFFFEFFFNKFFINEINRKTNKIIKHLQKLQYNFLLFQHHQKIEIIQEADGFGGWKMIRNYLRLIFNNFNDHQLHW